MTSKTSGGEEVVAEYNTVIFCVGREACTQSLNLDQIGVKVNPANKKIIANPEEQSSVPHVFAIGDVLDGKLELTPVAIQAGKLWAQVRHIYLFLILLLTFLFLTCVNSHP